MKNTNSVANSYSECKESKYTISSMNKTFGKWLSAKREKAGLTQEGLAEAAGVSPSYISALEREEINTKDGKPRQPKVDKVEKIARALGVPVDEARAEAGYAPLSGSRPKIESVKDFIDLIKAAGYDDDDLDFKPGELESMSPQELRNIYNMIVGYIKLTVADSSKAANGRSTYTK